MAVTIGAPSFNILIIGGGVAGLSAAISCKLKGFNVTVLEASPEFTHVGAGIFLGGNASRILCDMGLRAAMESCAVHQKKTAFLNHNSGHVLDVTEYGELEAKIGFPLWQLHRADLHSVLLNKATELSIMCKMCCVVKKYDWDAPAAVLDDGTVVNADIIIAADGYRSYARSNMLNRVDEPVFSGNSAYRALVDCKYLQAHPELKTLIDWEDQTTHVWVGDGRHVVAYPVREGRYYNIVLTQPAVRTTDSNYVVKVDPSEVVESYKDWDPRLQMVLKYLPEDATLEWRLCYLDPMESWIFPGGKIVLMGDACHAMLPSAAQGAGMGIEDGAALAELLARANSKDDIPKILKTYQKLRHPRTTAVVLGGIADAKKWHGKKPKAGVNSCWSWDYDVKTAAREIEIEAGAVMNV